MTTTTMQRDPEDSWVRRFFHTLIDLFRNQYGTARYVVNERGEFVHVETEFTVKIDKGETFETFVKRVHNEYEWGAGDRLEVLANGGKYDTIRVIRAAR